MSATRWCVVLVCTTTYKVVRCIRMYYHIEQGGALYSYVLPHRTIYDHVSPPVTFLLSYNLFNLIPKHT
jgi:hypothetical protein